MKVTVYDKAIDFIGDTRDILMRHEIANALIMGLADRASTTEDESENLYITITEGNQLKLAALMFGKNLVLSHQEDDYKGACLELLNYLESHCISYPGIIGTRPLADYFADQYNAVYKPSLDLYMNQRIYQLTKVEDVPISSGKMIKADMSHQKLVARFASEMSAEIGEAIIGDDVMAKVKKYIENQEVFLWEDKGEIVSICKKGRPTANSVTVTLVYTPKEHRGHGYASSVVARASRELLERYESCTLYTDLDYPTSNSIYMKIGYQPVCDSVVYEKEMV